MGAGPPISPPGRGGFEGNASSSARDIAAQRGQFGRDFAEQQRASRESRLTGPERGDQSVSAWSLGISAASSATVQRPSRSMARPSCQGSKRRTAPPCTKYVVPVSGAVALAR